MFIIKAQIVNPHYVAEVAKLNFCPSRQLVETLCTEYAITNGCSVTSAVLKHAKRYCYTLEFLKF